MGAAAAPAGPHQRSFLATLFGLYVEPGESFADILKRPRIWLSLLALVFVSVAFTAVWLQKADSGETIKAILEERGTWERIPPERRAAILDGSASDRFALQAWLGAVLGPGIVVLLVAVVMLFVFRFFYAGDVTFGQSLGVVAWTYLALGLVQTPLMLLVMALKGEWNVNPREALQANASLLVAKESVARSLYSLLGSLDLFSFWTMGLLATGFGLAVRRPFSSAMWGVAFPWAVYVAAKAGLAALMGS